MYFHYFVIISPLGKRWVPSYEQNWIPFNQGCFVPSLVEIGPVVLEKNLKMWKVYDKNDDNDNDDGQIFIRKAQLSLQLRWAKNGMM